MRKMLSSRLLLSKPTLNLLKVAKPKCHFYSSSPIGDSKKSDAVAESYLKKYIKGILTTMKDKVLGNPEPKNQTSTGISISTLNMKSSDVEPETVTPVSEPVSGSPSVEKISLASDIMEGISKTVCEKSTSLDIKMCKETKNAEICISKSPVQASKAMKKENSENKGENSASQVEENYRRPLSEIIVDFRNEKTISSSMYTCLKEEDSCKDLDFPRKISKVTEISNNSESIVEPDKGYKIPVDGTKPGHLVSLSSHFLTEKSKKTLDKDDFKIFNSKKSVHNQAGVVQTEKNEFSIDKSGGDVRKDSNIMGLVDGIKGLSGLSSVTSDKKFVISKTNQVNDKANLHVSKSKEGEISKKIHAMGKDNQISYKNSIRPGLSQTEVHNSEKKVKQCKLKNPVLSKESEKTQGSEKKGRTIQFMIDHENNNWTENSQDTTFSLKTTRRNNSILDLIGDPYAPTALVKNPTRTVKIEASTNTISLRELKKALDFCGYGVTFICMGSSSSAIYVEFKTEDAKERAIAAHSIQVLGDKLFISRIDIPRTTVVRISIPNVPDIDTVKIRNICCSYGQVIRVKNRLKETVDVEFGFVEWPNMVKILDKLNGLEKDGYRWVAQPAPIFPPKILKILWSDSDGRQHVKGVMSGILQKLRENSATIAKLTDLTSKYHGEEVNLS